MSQSKEHRLDQPRHEVNSLRLAMPAHDLRHVYERGAPGGAGVYDLEHRLEIPIQIHNRTSVTDELERLMPLVPPAMDRAKR